jgi:hypothetical protein
MTKHTLRGAKLTAARHVPRGALWCEQTGASFKNFDSYGSPIELRKDLSAPLLSNQSNLILTCLSQFFNGLARKKELKVRTSFPYLLSFTNTQRRGLFYCAHSKTTYDESLVLGSMSFLWCDTKLMKRDEMCFLSRWNWIRTISKIIKHTETTIRC